MMYRSLKHSFLYFAPWCHAGNAASLSLMVVSSDYSRGRMREVVSRSSDCNTKLLMKS